MPNKMEELASKGMGKAKQVTARVKGLTGIFAHLAEEHGEVSVLLKRVASSTDPAVRARLFPTIRSELLVHEQAERAELYPTLIDYADTRALVEHHDREAAEVETLLNKLTIEDFASPSWGVAFGQLADIVERHTSEEESVIFPRAQAILGTEAAAMLEHRYMLKKNELIQELM